MLQEKADVNAATKSSGITALKAADEGGHLTVVKRLLKEKSNVNAAADLMAKQHFRQQLGVVT